jgi:hypothetical protein
MGYTTVSRLKPTVYYVAGILIKNDSIEDRIKAVNSHLNKKGTHFRSVRKLKVTGDTLSVKVVALQSQIGDNEELMKDEFWPEGIFCRKWVN